MFEKKTTKTNMIKWAIYIVIAIIFYVLQSTPGLFEIYGVAPILLIPYSISIAMLEREVTAGFFGIFCGLLWDLSSGNLFGFNALILFILSILISLLVTNLLRCNWITNAMLTFFAIIIHMATYYFFFYFIWGYDQSLSFLAHYIVPMYIYTFLVGIIIFQLIKRIATRFNGEYI